jgi:tetratricopeptide (TPR) repeat protein
MNLRLAVPALGVFAALLVVLTMINRTPQVDPIEALGPQGTTENLTPVTAENLATYEDAVRAEPDDASALTSLGNTHLQAARETTDSAHLDRADAAFDFALRSDPDSYNATVGKASLALIGHEFADGLELGQTALRLEPALVGAYPVIVDAQIELGRYAAAQKSLERWLHRKPTLAAYSRVSYFRELHGDLDGAVQAIRLAVAAGGGSPEASAFTENLLGNLERARGRTEAAELAYRRALASRPEYSPAVAGLAGLDARRGNLDAAIRGFRTAMEGLPNAENATYLAEALEADGRVDEAAKAWDEAIEIATGDPVEVNQELVLLEADHGSIDVALEKARIAWRLAPGVTSADALAWALHSDGRSEQAWEFTEKAVALGTGDPALLFRAAQIAVATGRSAEAAKFLRRAVATDPEWSPVDSPRAAKLLKSLD